MKWYRGISVLLALAMSMVMLFASAAPAFALISPGIHIYRNNPWGEVTSNPAVLAGGGVLYQIYLYGDQTHGQSRLDLDISSTGGGLTANLAGGVYSVGASGTWTCQVLSPTRLRCDATTGVLYDLSILATTTSGHTGSMVGRTSGYNPQTYTRQYSIP